MPAFILCILLSVFVLISPSQAADIPTGVINDGRVFFSTFTVILSTVTSTTTVATTTSCTTSTAALLTCSVGRRRRGLFYDDAENKGHARRGLFYNDDEEEYKEGIISVHVKRSDIPGEAQLSSKVTIGEADWVPLTVQSGFSLPNGFPGAARFKLAYGTTTVTTTATTTATRSLTATCASTTSFQICTGVGK